VNASLTRDHRVAETRWSRGIIFSGWRAEYTPIPLLPTIPGISSARGNDTS